MNPLFNALVYLVWFIATFYSVYFILSVLVFSDKLFEGRKAKNKRWHPSVTLLIPAFNEEASIAQTIKSLAKLTYSKVDYIILNDGSNDNTAKIIRKELKTVIGKSRFKFFDNKENLGKAGVLNFGIKKAKGEFVACLDADSIVEKNIIQKVLPYFEDKDTGAVTVSVSVHKPKTLLHKMVAVEFALGLSLFLKVFSHLGCIFVTPGPFTLYRKVMLEDIGGYDPTNITEDHEIAFRIHKTKYKIKCCMEAKVETILPGTFKEIYVQRRRWYAGAIQTIIKHKDMILNRKYGFFGLYLPFHYTLIALGFISLGLSIYLYFSKLFSELMYFRYTDFNFLQHMSFSIDLLTYGRVNILGLSMFAMTIFMMYFGIKFTRKKFSQYKAGVIGFPFMFFLYQIFWGGAIIAVLKNKKIKWR